MEWIENEFMTTEAAALANALESLGVHVCGSVREFGYAGGEDAVWVAADSTPDLFDYWNHDTHPSLEALVEKHGYYFEWNDPGTIMAYKL